MCVCMYVCVYYIYKYVCIHTCVRVFSLFLSVANELLIVFSVVVFNLCDSLFVSRSFFLSSFFSCCGAGRRIMVLI